MKCISAVYKKNFLPKKKVYHKRILRFPGSHNIYKVRLAIVFNYESNNKTTNHCDSVPFYFLLQYFDHSSWGCFSGNTVYFHLKTTSAGVYKISWQRINNGFEVVREKQKYDMNCITYCIISLLFKSRNTTLLVKKFFKKMKKCEWAHNGFLPRIRI